MKKLLSILLAGAMLAGVLSGCGGQSQPSAALSADPTSAPSDTGSQAYPTATTE